jgi:hypothetical protein
MRRVLFASTLIAALGSSAAAFGQAHASDLACIRTSKGQIACGQVLRSSDRTLSKRHSKRQRALQEKIDGDGSHRTPHHSLARRYGDDVVPGIADLLEEFNPRDRTNPGNRTRNVDIPMPRQHPLRAAYSEPMPRQRPLRATLSDAVPRTHSRHVVYRQASRKFSGGEVVPREPRFDASDHVTTGEIGPRGNSPRAEVRDRAPQDIDHGIASALAQKAQSYRTIYPDLRPYEEDTRQPDDSSDARRDGRGKRPERE